MKIHAKQVFFDRNLLTNNGLKDRLIDVELTLSQFGVSEAEDANGDCLMHPWAHVTTIKYAAGALTPQAPKGK